MDEKIKLFRKGFIDSTKKIIEIELHNNENEIDDKHKIFIDVASTNNDDFILNLIDLANRQYSATLYEINQSDLHKEYGCLTTKVIGLNELPITFINPKYIINLFLKILQCLFKDDEKYLKYFNRDSLEIPTSENNLMCLINELVYNTTTTTNNNNNDNNKMEIDDDNDTDPTIDFRNLINLLLNFLANAQNKSIEKKINSGRFKKQATICGGFSNIHNIQNSLQNNIKETLSETGKNIHKLINEYKDEIYNNINCKNDINIIKSHIDNNPDLDIYRNVNISFKFMMRMIGNIFNVLLLNIFPQKSMLSCLHGTLYQASFLHEMNILKYHSKIIQMPLLFRLIYSFYKDNNYSNIPYNYQDDAIYNLINKLCKQDKNFDTICEIAFKIDIQNINQLDFIYWTLNEKRGYTFEYYFMIIISIFIKGKCQNMNNKIKHLNSKNFCEPLYELMYKFYNFVIKDIGNLQTALCTDTFDNFNKLYSKEINTCIKMFTENERKKFK